MIKTVTKWTVSQLKQNTSVSTVIAGAAVSGVAALLRDAPSHIKAWFHDRFIVTLKITSDDTLFPYMEKWLYKKLGPNAKRLRAIGNLKRRGDNLNIAINNVIGSHEDHEEVEHYFTPDTGNYTIWHEGRRFSIFRGNGGREARNSFTEYGKLNEEIVLSTISRDTSIFNSIIAEVSQGISKKETIPFYMKGSFGWDEINTLYPRSLDTIYINPDDKQKVIDDLEEFLTSKNWYRKRNVPYRRGYLFSGLPGTGKSSFVVALATYFDLPLFAINLGSIGTDDVLIKTMQALPRRCICLIEDIDAAAHSINSRAPTSKKKDDSPIGANGFTLSSFLNSIDGVYATDERILIMTTNFPDQIDDALIRPGRVDLHIVFNKITNAAIEVMLNNFYEQNVTLPSHKLEVVPAQLQQKLLENRIDPKRVLTWLKTQKVK